MTQGVTASDNVNYSNTSIDEQSRPVAASPRVEPETGPSLLQMVNENNSPIEASAQESDDGTTNNREEHLWNPSSQGSVFSRSFPLPNNTVDSNSSYQNVMSAQSSSFKGGFFGGFFLMKKK